ncbi:hypothetical protein PCL_01646 [Purpureocillium lilacinum]|uniref:Uncharacterized protein n=1 Tax=Purpureocillium lilacinum TaxID=33203 RepID=A0A2U3E230_PURLI|nr:hypothetical protein PCL_01646 [Purpureocillium lilacinum]
MGKASQGTIHGVRSHTAVAPAVLAIVGKGLAVHWPQRTGAQPARFRGTPSLHVCLEIRLPARETNLPCQLREALCLCPGAPTVRAAGAPREGCYGRGCSSIAARTQGSPRIHAIELMARRRAEIMLNCRSPTKRAYWRSSFVRQWWLCEDRRNHWEIWLPRRLRPAQVPGVLMMILTEGGCAGRARVTRGGCTETQRPTRCQGHTTGDLRRAKGHGSSGATAMHLRDGASASLNAFGAVTLLLEAIGKGGELGGLSRADHGCFGDAALTQTDPCCAATRSTVPTGLLALARGEK